MIERVGGGYEADKFKMAIGSCRQREHYRDTYHVNQKIKDRLSFDRPMENQLRKALRAYDWAQIESVLASAQSRATACSAEIAAERLDQIERLRGYLSRYCPYHQPIADCSLPVPSKKERASAKQGTAITAIVSSIKDGHGPMMVPVMWPRHPQCGEKRGIYQYLSAKS